MAKVNLTDRKLKSLRPAPAGKRYELLDAAVAGLGVRVTETGLRTFILKTRYPGSPHPTRRALGEYPVLTLEEAREKAAGWRKLIGRGIDPSEQEAAQRVAEQRRRANSFAAVAEDFIAEKLPGERKAREIERDIRRDLLPAWGGRPIVDIEDSEIASLIKLKARRAPAQARNLLGTVKRLFGWAIDQRAYGLKVSPAVQLKPAALCGEKVSGQRILTDPELVALVRAARRMRSPYGRVYQLLALTGLRLNEVADASWPEFDLKERVWTIPAERMKGKNSKARSHVVPLTDDILSIINSLPKFKAGDYLFSTTFGKSSVWVNSKVKTRVDARMLRMLRALARRCGDDPTKVTLQHWTNHDIRRTVRSGLSRLKISDAVCEAALAHVRPGIVGVYDRHSYLAEKREALELWAAHVRSLINPSPDNVVALAQVRA